MQESSLISHEECYGFNADAGIAFLNIASESSGSIFAIEAGNFIQICQYQKTLDILLSINGEVNGFSAFAACPLTNLLAYAERVKNPQIRIINIKGVDVTTITMAGCFGVRTLDFSYDGQWLYVLGGLPTFRFAVFNMTNYEEATSKTFTDPIGNKLSISPTNPRLVAIYGDEKSDFPRLPGDLDTTKPVHLRFYTLEGSRKNFKFTEQISEVSSNVLSLAWTPFETCVVSTDDGQIVFVNPTTGKIIGEPFDLIKLGDHEQVATALLCSSKYLYFSGSGGNFYWLPLDNFQAPREVLDQTPLKFMYFFPGTDTIVFGTEENGLLCIPTDENEKPLVSGPDGESPLVSLREGHHGPVNAICALPHHLFTVDSHGWLRVWLTRNYLTLMVKIFFKDEYLTSLATSSGGTLVAIGSKSGIVRILNTSELKMDLEGDPIYGDMKLLFRERLHQAPVTAITISHHYIVSGSSLGSIVIQKTDPMSAFPLIGLLQIKSPVVSLTTPPPLGTLQQLLIATAHREVLRIDMPNEPADGFKLGIETMNRAMLKVSNKISQIVAEPTLREDQQYFYCGCDDKSVRFFCMPITTGDLDIVGVDDVESSAPDDTFVGHPKSVTALALSPSQRFIASGCAGGNLIVREQDVKTAQVKMIVLSTINHSAFDGAITSLAFSPDGKHLFTAGLDGAINSYELKVESFPLLSDGPAFQMPQGCFTNSISSIFNIDQQLRSLAELWQEHSTLTGNDNGFPNDDGEGYRETSLLMQMKQEKLKKQQQERDDFQDALMAQVTNIKNQLDDFVTANEDAPELEKLSKTDFTLDTAAAERLANMAKVRAELVKYQHKIKNQIRLINAQTITQKCFTPYEPKLTTLFSLKTPIACGNFPLPVRTAKQKRLLQCVSMLRRTEIAALRYKPPSNDPNRVGISNSRDQSVDGSRYLSSRSNSLVTLPISESEQEMLIKDDARLLYDPFSLVTGNRKVIQIMIVQHIIMEEMEKFNIVFDEMLGKKQNLVQSLEEKNKRIRQLVRLLHLNQEDYPLFEPTMMPDETSDSFLTVNDDEVHIEDGADLMAKTQEKNDDVDKDSFAERALRQMMGGNVNMNSIEEAPADDEPQRPEWMETKKKEEMTEEEQYQIQEFEKKLKNFIEEREKRRKALNAELTKLIKGNQTSVEDFDKQMCQMYNTRFDTEERVYYHELEIMHLIISLNEERECRNKLAEISEEMYNLSANKRHQQPVLTELSAESATYTKAAQTAEENLDSLKSQVSKEFNHRDCINQLMRLFGQISKREKPKILSQANPFREFIRPPFVFSDDDQILSPQSKPSSLADAPWKNFTEYCEAKRRLSRDAAEKSTDANHLKTLVRTYETEMAAIEDRLVQLEGTQQHVTDRLLNTLIDLHIPFTFRQGQVEIPSDLIMIDYNDVVLINKKVVEERNTLIKDAGQRKIDELEAIRSQRSNHKVLKWEIDKCKVELENLNEEVKEYQLFRVTKLDQELIMGGGKNRNQSMVNSLNNSLTHTQATHSTRMKRAQETLKKLQAKVSQKKTENDKVEEEILQMQLGLKERKRIYNIQMKSSEGANEAQRRRLKTVMMISKLKRAKQVQEGKIAELREEVSRIRKSAFTSFNEGGAFDSMVDGYQS